MRYRTFDLFAELGMEKTDLKSNPGAADGSIIPYYMKNGDDASSTIEPWSYNDITKWGTYNGIRILSTNDDPFEISTDGSIPKEYGQNNAAVCSGRRSSCRFANQLSRILKHSPDDVMKAAIEPFRQALKDDSTQTPPGRSGWNLLMKYDTLSTREYLTT